MLTALIQIISNRQRRPLLRALPRGSVGAEIGVFRGVFSRKILATLRPRELHLIDPWKYHPDPTYKRSWYGGSRGGDQAMMDAVHDGVVRRFQAEIDAGAVKIHRCMSAEAAAKFPDAFFDWVYIDGNHLYEFVKQDLELFFPKVKPGGLLAGDDYGVRGWWDHGVTRAVDEFAASGRCRPVSFRKNQFILQRPART